MRLKVIINVYLTPKNKKNMRITTIIYIYWTLKWTEGSRGWSEKLN